MMNNDASTWEPVPLDYLTALISRSENEMDDELRSFWESIKIIPEKWQQFPEGEEGGGFWVVAIHVKKIIWYNDIEEGFNISPYKEQKVFEEYWCNQDELLWAVRDLLIQVRYEANSNKQASL